jgi:hypothetical protein
MHNARGKKKGVEEMDKNEKTAVDKKDHKCCCCGCEDCNCDCEQK